MFTLPLVSIGTPVYNGEDFIRQAIESVISQDYPNIEMVISDNASTDSTQSICEEYATKYPQIKYYRQSTNLGMNTNFNASLELAQGEFFCWLSHDDFLAPTYISKCLDMLDRYPQAIACCSEINFVNYDGSIREGWTKAYKNFDALNKDVVGRVHELISKVGWFALYSVFRIDVLKSMSKCQDRYPDDVLLMLEWLLVGEIANIPEYLYNYRVPNIDKNHEDYIRAFRVPPAMAAEVRKGSFTYTAKEILNFVCKYNISAQDKYLIKEDFIRTLCCQNFDWLKRILHEQNFVVTATTTDWEIKELLCRVIISPEVSAFFVKNVPSTFSNNNVKSMNLSNLVVSFPSKPRIDVVLQATGTHGWCASEGWVNTLQREGLLNRVFRPNCSWGVEKPVYDDGLFEYLRNPQADIMLLLGFDWHSQPLHHTTEWKERWQQSQITKIAVLQECYSSEVLKSVLAWEQQMHKAFRSTLSCVDALICHHEPDVAFLKNTFNVSLPITFLPFAVDTEYFKDDNLFSNKLNRVLFQGSALRLLGSDAYKERQVLMEILSHQPQVDLFPSNLVGEKQAFQIMHEYTSELRSYRMVLNLPSISSTLTVRPFEVMACGGLLLQNKIIGEESNTLFEDWHNIVYYDASKPDDLISKINILTKDENLTQAIAKRGNELCNEKHTIGHRVNAILSWIDSISPRSTSNSYALVDGKKLLNSHTRIIIDGVFFQLYQTGIARVWKSLLEEWSQTDFIKNIVVLDRANTAPKISGVRYCQIPAYDYNDTDADRGMLQQVCNELGADLFISTYYTTPLETPSVFMGYDMIPEVLGADLNHQMWQEKRYAIEHASAYLTISEHTAKDLVEIYSNIDPNTVTVAHCGVQSVFKQASITNLAEFRYKYGIAKPYFVIGASGGYKNIELFLQAFDRLPSKSGFDIIVTGGHVLSQEDRQYTFGSNVHYLRLDDFELSLAYAGAIALVYPSKYEGFGLPIVEAMASGCPVITCPNASIPEVAGEAAIYVFDDDIDGMAEALCEVQKPQVRAALITAGLKQVKQFSWTKMADIVKSVLIEQTLTHLQLSEDNLIIFPDWSQDEEELGEEISRVCYNLAQSAEFDRPTLLIDTTNAEDIESVNMLVSGIAMNLMMGSDIDITEHLEIALTGNLAPIQWQALLPKLHGRIKLEQEDVNAIESSGANLISEIQLTETPSLSLV
jgi:glycosyltransferase involved in cell wall biosynthesis